MNGVFSRRVILKTYRRTMILLPSVAIAKSTSRELVAWAFLGRHILLINPKFNSSYESAGPDGSLTTLHCEV